MRTVSIDTPVTETLPSGRSGQCELPTYEPVYIEQAVSDTAYPRIRLDRTVSEPAGTVFGWLVRVPRTYASESVTRPPAEIRDDLMVNGFDLQPSSVLTLWRWFRCRLTATSARETCFSR